jgi:hypothetical protein
MTRRGHRLYILAHLLMVVLAGVVFGLAIPALVP